MTGPSLEAARRDADLARERLVARVANLQERLRPAVLVEQVRGEIRRNAETGAERIVAEARKRPKAVGFAAAGAAALLIAPRLLRAMRRGRKTSDTSKHGDHHDGGQAQAPGRRARKRDG